MSIIISPQEYARQQVARKIEHTIQRQDPSAIVLGPGLQRSGDLTEKTYDDEVEYDITKYPNLEAEIRELEDRARNAKRVTSELLDEAQRQHALTEIAHAQYRWQGQERWQGHENVAARMVNIINCREFVRKLAGVRVKVWLNDFSRLGRIGVNARIPDPDTGKMENRTITTLQYPWSYEWSVMRFNEYNVPTQEKFRGWRTALLALVVSAACTEKQAHLAFGAPSNSQVAVSGFYLQTLVNYRENKGMFRPSLDKVAKAAMAEAAAKPKLAKARLQRHVKSVIRKYRKESSGGRP